MKDVKDIEDIKEEVRAAFDAVPRPGNWALLGSQEGEEPALVEEAFRDKLDWRALDSDFLDSAPDGFASALSFLSDEAFRYFLPAYLLADLDGRLSSVDPVFHLTHGLTNETRERKINPRRFGDRTWFDGARYRFSTFNPEEAAAIVSYLRHKQSIDDYSAGEIEEALENYWLGRVSTASR